MSDERPIRLHAGPWSLEFERWSGWVRAIRYQGFEVVRAVYAVCRGPEWQTLHQFVRTTHVSQEDGHAEARWEAEVDEIGFNWSASISVLPTSIEIRVRGKSTQAFESRRVGMCALLPQELAGTDLELGHPSGETEPLTLPELVSPTLPSINIASFDLKALHSPVKLEFSGDAFHMEDQRNWTDASYKVYSGAATRLAPYEYPASTEIEQALTIKAPVTDILRPEVPPLNLGAAIGTFEMPEVGTVSADLEDYVDFVLPPGSSNPWSEALQGHVAEFGILADLNANRPTTGTFTAIAFGAQPQTHAFDNRTIMENVHALPPALATAREISKGQPVYLGPLIFSGRDPNDERFGEPVGEAWLAACLVMSAVGGAKAVCIADSPRLTENQKDILASFTSSESLQFLLSSDPYRVLGAKLSDGTSVAINMTPFLQILTVEGRDVELRGFEVRFEEPIR